MNSEKTHNGFVARLKQIMGDEKPYPWASRLGIAQATFNRMWKEGWIPKGETLLLISEKTGYSIDWLLTGEGPMKRGELIWSDSVKDRHPRYSYATTNYDRELNEIIELLQHDLPESKEFVLKVLRGKKEIKEGLKGLGMNGIVVEEK